MNETIYNFDYHNTLLKEFNNWVLLVRKKQITFGSMVLIIKRDVYNFNELHIDELNELKIVFNFIEKKLKQILKFKKINYIALMMVDPHVHFHVIPRYETQKQFNNDTYVDYGWPGIPNFDIENPTIADLTKFKEYLKL